MTSSSDSDSQFDIEQLPEEKQPHAMEILAKGKKITPFYDDNTLWSIYKQYYSNDTVFLNQLQIRAKQRSHQKEAQKQEGWTTIGKKQNQDTKEQKRLNRKYNFLQDKQLIHRAQQLMKEKQNNAKSQVKFKQNQKKYKQNQKKQLKYKEKIQQPHNKQQSEKNKKQTTQKYVQKKINKQEQHQKNKQSKLKEENKNQEKAQINKPQQQKSQHIFVEEQSKKRFDQECKKNPLILKFIRPTERIQRIKYHLINGKPQQIQTRLVLPENK